jgi:sodium/potassium/calcium exchanger 6
VYVFLTFGLSIVWIYLAANELVNLLEAIGLVMHLSETILGATVLAWGNSIGDMVADVVMSRAGYPGMAIAATYGGPLFNLLIGLGVAMTITTIKTLPNPFLVEIDNLFFVTGSRHFFLSESP